MAEQQGVKARIAKQFGFALKDPNPNIRFLALEGLQFLAGYPECELVLKLISDPDRFVKWKAIQVCGSLRLKSAIPMLIKNLNSVDFYARSFSALALGMIGDAASLPTLLEIARKESSPKVRQNLVRFIPQFAPGIPWEFLANCCRDEDVGVRLETTRTLGFLTSFEETCPLLTGLLEQETDPHIFATALLILGRFKKDSLFPYFRESLTHHENRIRANAIEALGNFAMEKVETIISPFLKDPSNRVKANVIGIFLQHGYGNKVHWELQKLLTSANRWDRSSGAWLAGTFKITNSVDQLIKLLSDEEAVVAERSAWALGKINLPGTMDALLKVYWKANQWALTNIVKAMAGVAAPKDVQGIQKLMDKERNPIIKAQMIDILTSIKALEAREYVLKLKNEGEQRIRASVYTYLGQVDPQNSTEILFEGLSDAHHKVRALCADLMLQAGDFRALKVLSELLNEKDKLLKLQATHTLRDLAERVKGERDT